MRQEEIVFALLLTAAIEIFHSETVVAGTLLLVVIFPLFIPISVG